MSIRNKWEMCCPQCGHDDSLTVEAVTRTTVRLCGDGTDDQHSGDGFDWNSKSSVDCSYCAWSGIVHQATRAYKESHAAAAALMPEGDAEAIDSKINATLYLVDKAEELAIAVAISATLKEKPKKKKRRHRHG